MKKMKLVFAELWVCMILLCITAPSEAFVFKQKHFAGEYHCTGSGNVESEKYLWGAIFFSDGKGGYVGSDSVMLDDGSIAEPSLFVGAYEVNEVGSLSLHGYGEQIGIMVSGGKGILIGQIGKGTLFTGQCWRAK